MSTKNALVILANGFEEIEAVTPIDLLIRADLKVTIAGHETMEVYGSHGIKIVTETTLSSLDGIYDALIIPGGPGHKELAESDIVLDLVRSHYNNNRLCAAICAGPFVLFKASILKGLRFTCFPSVVSSITGSTFIDQPVVTDGHCITSSGAGTAIPFSLAIIEYLTNKTKADSIASAILYS